MSERGGLSRYLTPNIINAPSVLDLTRIYQHYLPDLSNKKLPLTKQSSSLSHLIRIQNTEWNRIHEIRRLLLRQSQHVNKAMEAHLKIIAEADRIPKTHQNREKHVHLLGHSLGIMEGLTDPTQELASFDFNLLVKDLEVHGGRLILEEVFYWKFDNVNVVGRKPK